VDEIRGVYPSAGLTASRGNIKVTLGREVRWRSVDKMSRCGAQILRMGTFGCGTGIQLAHKHLGPAFGDDPNVRVIGVAIIMYDPGLPPY